MTRHLLLVSMGVDLANTSAAGQPAEAVAPDNAIHAGIGDGDGVITRQVPNNAYGPQAVGRAQVQHFLDDLRRRAIGGIFGAVLRFSRPAKPCCGTVGSSVFEAGEPSCVDETLVEHDGELGLRLGPFARRTLPLCRGTVQS